MLTTEGFSGHACLLKERQLVLSPCVIRGAGDEGRDGALAVLSLLHPWQPNPKVITPTSSVSELAGERVCFKLYIAAMAQLFLLSESASGYALLEVLEADVIASQTDQVQAATAEFARFATMVKLSAFAPFTSAEHALENANLISEGAVSEYLQNFLQTNLPRGAKVKKGAVAAVSLGVARDPKLKSSVTEALDGSVQVLADERVEDLLRGVRTHFEKFIEALKPGDLVKSQLGLAHSYSRSKVKFNVHKSDNMIIQSIALLDQLDKDINTFAMRVREWYSWHFPELYKVIPDNIQYARLVRLVKDKATLTDESIDMLNTVLLDEDKAKDVLDAARSSMGTDVSPIDLVNIEMFASRVVSLAEYRANLHNYLVSKMNAVAPNLAALIGEQVGARLISHAGSLTSLAKYPASTVQILGAEKALFRALKTKGKTPKYGLLYHSTFIGRAKAKNKGRISRYLANKCSIASRMDCFADNATDVFGKKLRDQVEERLRFYESGTAPRKNLDVMKEAMKEAAEEAGGDNAEARNDSDDDEKAGKAAAAKKKAEKAAKKALKESGKKEKKSKTKDDTVGMEIDDAETPKSVKEKKRRRESEGGSEKKKSKKSKA
jgi:nucleolar protein 56